MRDIKINNNDVGQRLDRFVGKYLPKAGYGFIQRNIRQKRIKINRKNSKAGDFLKAGDVVNFFIYDEVLDPLMDDRRFTITKENVDFIYEDENIGIIYKPAGVLTQGDETGDESLVDRFISTLIKSNEFEPEEEASFVPAFANRLDRGTAGLLLGAKKAQALRELNRGLRNRSIARLYKAIVVGEVKEDMIFDQPLLKLEDNRVIVSEDGQEAKTILRPIDVRMGYSLVELELVSGRSHQIRVHLAEAGFPIIGDRLYGDQRENQKLASVGLNNQYLLSYGIGFQDLGQPLDYLNGKSFYLEDYPRDIENYFFGEEEK